MAMLNLIVALAFSLPILAAPSADTTAVCKALYGKYPHQFAWDPLGPNGGQTLSNASLYSDVLHDYWNGDNADNRAACMLFPGSADEVSFAVKTLNKYPSVPYALKSGGHNANKGFSSVDQGVLVSFRPNLAATTISADRSTADIGPGSRWDEVMTVLDPYGRAAIGGRLGNVGVGGYLLGGGLSFLTSQYGFACDSIVNYELVLADGTITNANSTSETDLFWALKGGGNQFGVVTKFTVKTVPMGQIWGGTRIYSGADHHKDLLSAATNFTREFKDPKSAVIVTFDYTLADLVDLVVMFYYYDGPEPPAGVFDEFDAIPSISSNTKAQSYPDLLKANNEYSLHGLRYAIRETTFPNLPHANMTDFLGYHYDTFKDFAFGKSLTNLDVQVLSFAIQPISAGLQKASNDAGGNRLGLDPNHGDLIFMENDISWINPICDDRCPGYLRSVVDKVEEYERRTYHGMKPTNYVSGDVDFISYNPIFYNDGQFDQAVLQSYGADTYAKMKGIQKRRDPNGFFSARQGGFKFST